ncbi:hypothetical protein PKOR_00710 [Pontibacter korlensis]|uniref:Glycosyl transferase family 1 n=1 Tax=Pontibacter korlensis TaxID=400092 RepID=A0A0E3ZHF5_9BACT|nr:hypothetical protein PKOR_00710 [Pontibacter korlensis]
MHISHIISTIDIHAGGPSKSVCDLSVNQTIIHCSISIITRPSTTPYLRTSPNDKLALTFTKNFDSELSKKSALGSKNHILHGHGIWQMPVHQMAVVARRYNVPYIITPRGMLEPWALKAGKWKKKLALSMYQRKDLAKAACIHATAPMEAENIRKLGFKNPIAVIPNGIDVKEFPVKKRVIQKSRRTLLFLSRIHPKKGIEILIEAWAHLSSELKYDWHVEIAGNGDKAYIEQLKQLIINKGLSEEISILGPQFEEAKIRTYHRADLFVLPTYSENFGVVVAEALACGVPVITTKGAPWEDLERCNAGWWIDVGVEPLKACLREALAVDAHSLIEMGRNGRKLVKEDYSIQAVAKQTIELYKWVLGEGETPKFVYAD